MKLVTKLTIIATVASFMFAGMNITWGNAYTNEADDLAVADQFGVWLDVNDSMSFGWEGAGVKVGFDGPAGMQMRLGFDPSHAVTGVDGKIVGCHPGLHRTATGAGADRNVTRRIHYGCTGG